MFNRIEDQDVLVLQVEYVFYRIGVQVVLVAQDWVEALSAMDLIVKQPSNNRQTTVKEPRVETLSAAMEIENKRS